MRTVAYWCANEEFSAEVDRLTLMTGIASRAERLRIAKKVIRQRIREHDGFVHSNKDSLEWLKFAQGETDGIKLDLASLAETASSLADTGPDRTSEPGNPAEPGATDGDE